MLFRDIFHLYGKVTSLQGILKHALKSQPNAMFQEKYGTQGDLFLKLIQSELQQFTSDPDWVKAKALSDRIRAENATPNSSPNIKKSKDGLSAANSKRQFSTFSKQLQKGDSESKKVC